MPDLKEKSIGLLATEPGIDAKSIATTVLYVVPAGKVMIPMFVVIRVTAFTVGAKGVQAVASFGGNSATYDDFLNTVTYTIAAVNTFLTDGPAGPTTAVVTQAAADSFRISIETGSDATTETWEVSLFGFLI